MVKITKIVFASLTVILLIVYIAQVLNLDNSVNERITKLEMQAAINDRKKEYYMEQSISLEAVKNNLQADLAIEKDRAVQKKLLTQLNSLKEEEKQAFLAEQQRLEQARLAELQKLQQQQIIKKTSSSSSGSSSSSTTSTPSTPTKVTSAS